MANSSDKKYFDVAKPGKLIPEPTSRPVLVTNRPIVKDPTLKHPDESDDLEISTKQDESKPITATSEGRTIEPSKEAVEEVASNNEAEKNESNTDTSMSEQGLDPAFMDKKKQNEVQDAEAEHQTVIEGLIANGSYALPIGHIKHRRGTANTAFVIILLLLVTAALVYILIDAGILKTGVHVPVDFIKN